MSIFDEYGAYNASVQIVASDMLCYIHIVFTKK